MTATPPNESTVNTQPDQKASNIMKTPTIAKCAVYPVAGQDSMELNLSGAHAPYFTRNILVLEDSDRQHRGRRSTRRREDHPTLQRLRIVVTGASIANYRSILDGPHHLRRPRLRRARPPDLRPADHHPRRDRRRIGAARPAGPAPRPSRRGTARRRRAATRLGKMLGYLFYIGDRTRPTWTTSATRVRRGLAPRPARGGPDPGERSSARRGHP